MKFLSRPSLSKAQVSHLFTDTENALLDDDKIVNVYTIATLSNTGSLLKIERDLERGDIKQGELASNDKNGQLVSRDDNSVTIYAKLTASTFAFEHMGGAMLSIMPEGRDIDPIGTFFENFRIRKDYLPCPLGTKAGDKWTNGSAVAIVDIETQTVLDLAYVNEGIPNSLDGCGEVVASMTDEKTIAVSCVLANGGVNFACLIP